MKELFKSKKIFLGNIAIIILNFIIIGYICILLTGIAFSFPDFIMPGVIFADDSLQWNRYLALLVNVFVIIICFILRGKVKNKIRTENENINTFVKRVFISISLLVPAVILICIFYYLAVSTDKLRSKVDLPSQNVSVAMAVAEIRPDEVNEDLFNVEIKIRCKEDKEYSFTRRAEISLDYHNGKPEIKTAEASRIFMDTNSKVEWKNCMGMNEIPPVDTFQISVPKDTAKYNFYGRFQMNNLTIRTELFTYLPFMFLYNTNNYKYIWQSDYLNDSFEIPVECFIYAKEFGKYVYIDQRQFFDFKHNNNIRQSHPSGERKMVKGSCVYIKNGADDYNGTDLYDYVYDRVYRISRLDENRAVLMYDDQIVAAVNVTDLYFAKEF